jgi:hypothetical protein
LTNIILKNKKKKKYVGKHRSNLQYFKGKKLQSKIFNQLNIKKIDKYNFENKKIK